MRMRTLSLAAVLGATCALAGELEEAEAAKAAKGRYDEALASMNEKCGTSISATYDLKTEKYERERYDETNRKWRFEPNRTEGQFRLERGHGYDLCACAFKGIERHCEKDTFKAFLKAKVRSMPCEFRFLTRQEREWGEAWDKSRKLPPGMLDWEVSAQRDNVRHEYQDGVLKTFVDADASNCGDYTSKYVRRNLGFEDAEALEASKARFAEALSSMNEKCGTTISATYDLSSEKLERERFDEVNKKWVIQPNPTGGQARLAPGYGFDACTCAFKGIERNCDKDAFKAALAKKVKSMKCEHKFLTRIEREQDEALQKTGKLPKGLERWEVDAQRDNLRHELKGGVLQTFIDGDTSNCGEFTSKWMSKKL